MNKKEFNLSVSTRDNSAKVVRGVIQYDTGNLFNVNILEGTKPFDFTGYTNVVIEILKPDGTVYVDGDGGSLDVLDAEYGTVSFTLQPQCVLITGMHFVAISIFSNGVKVTTARLNYYVSESAGGSGDVTSTSEFPILQLLIAQNSNILESEQLRQIAERLRQEAEAHRVNETEGVLAQAQKAIEQAQSYVDNVKDWYDLFMSAAGDIAGVDLSTVVTQTNLADALKDIDCGGFTGATKTLHIRGGNKENLPALKSRELGFVYETQELFIGYDWKNILINKPAFVAQATAPDDTSILWIDTANNNALKFYNGIAWAGTSTAVFG